MAKVSDVLRELEDIGVLGEIKAPPEAVKALRAAAPIRNPPKPHQSGTTVRVNGILSGFEERLGMLEEAIEEMHQWCVDARSYLAMEEQDAESADNAPSMLEHASEPEPEPEPETETETEPTQSEVVAAPVAESPPTDTATATEPASEPRKTKTIEEIRAQFFAPDAIVAAAVPAITQTVAQRILQINKAEEAK